MRNFNYIAAGSLDLAVNQLTQAGLEGRVLAGGTDLIVAMREGRRVVETLIDIKSISDLNVLEYDPESGLRLGAAVPCHRIYEHPDVRRWYPALVDSTSLIGGTGIQGRASVGGNLCNASPAADTIPTLMALSAVCKVAGPQGRREIPIEEFCVAPGRNALQAGELLVELVLPPPAPGSGAFFLRFIPRNEMDIAVVNAAASLQLDEDGQTIRAARLAVGAVAPTPLLIDEAANVLVGARASEESFARAAEAAQRAAQPISDMRGTNVQRRHLVGVLTRRALQGALERARTTH
ncbi:MAG TPA: xanthine dehydrogenase family protein subunit M [Chloroflexota bacterium]|nr:xanthine dehydrogenase family protein subunit M [Chloroflexota bacterium]